MPQVLRELGDEIVGLPVLAVVKEVARDASTRTHLVEFAEHYFTAGPVYYDSTLSIYRALGHRERLRRISMLTGPYLLVAKHLPCCSLGARLRAKGAVNHEWRDTNEAFVQGGVLLMGPGGQGVHYAYREVTGSPLPKEPLRAALRSMPRAISWP
jgi:hypothetical protein